MTNLYRILILPALVAALAILYACIIKPPSSAELFGLIICLVFPVILGFVILAKATRNDG